METQRILMRSLAVALVIASVIWTTTAQEQKEYSCCTKVSSSVVTDPIIGIKFQRKSLPCVKAVIFETEQGNKQGKDFCRDPKQRWVKEKVRQFFKTTPSPTSSISDGARARESTQTTDRLLIMNV